MRQAISRSYRSAMVHALFIGLCTILPAQNANTAGGGMAQGHGGSISYSVGQVFYSAAENGGTFISKGVQQSYAVSHNYLSVPTKNELTGIKVFPNPTKGNITIEIPSSEKSELHYIMYNSKGKAITQNYITPFRNNLNIKHLPSGLYTIRIFNKVNIGKTFKVIKY